LPGNSLIPLGILPTNAEYYTPEQRDLLQRLLIHKCSLKPKHQNTLSVILSGGEITYEIESKHITALYVKLQEKLSPKRKSGIKSGRGSHSGIRNTDVRINPNMDRTGSRTGKAGAYHGQLDQVRNSIIRHFAKILTQEDYDNLQRAEDRLTSPNTTKAPTK
jgi:hypothetical protein